MDDQQAYPAWNERAAHDAPHAVLGVPADAGKAAVQSAYRRLARRYHPDVNHAPDAAERMRAINAAYAALCAPPSAPQGADEQAPAGRAPASGRVNVSPWPAAAPWMWPGLSPAWAGATPFGSGGTIAASSHQATALGVVIACFVLTGALAAWALSVAWAAGTSARTTSPMVVPAAGAPAGDATRSAAALASANAAANAQAARHNALSAATGSVVSAPGSSAGPAGVPRSDAALSPASGRLGAAAAPGQPALSVVAVPSEAAPGAPLPPLAATPPDRIGGSGVGAVQERAAAPATTAASSESLGATSPAVSSGPATRAAPSEAVAPAVRGASGGSAAGVTPRELVPSLPVAPVPAGNTPAGGTHIQAVGSVPAVDAGAALPAATRALSAYDKAWTSYVSVLRFAAAGTLAPAAGSAAGASPMGSTGPSGAMGGAGSIRVTGAGAASLLSGEGQVTIARVLYLQQQIVWHRHAAAVLAASPAATTRPDGAKSARADLRLRQAAEVIAQAHASGTPVPVGQVKALLDEAETLHRESIAEWASLLASAAA